MTTTTYTDLYTLATEHQITPVRCARCGQARGDWHIGYDAGDDPSYVGYQCQGCGHVEGLSRRTILRRVSS